MFQVGELVVYGSTGVCRVQEIRPMGPDKREYYVLSPLYQTCTISAPVGSTKVFMRPILTKQEAEALVTQIPHITAEPVHDRSLQQLTEHYKASLETHDCADLVELAKSIYAKKCAAQKLNRKLGSVDERFMKRAEELLFGELAAALEIPVDQVQAYIQSKLE